MKSGKFCNKIVTRHLPPWGAGPAPGNLLLFPDQASFKTLTHPGKSSWMNWNETKASFIQVERKKEARVGCHVKEATFTFFKNL